MNTILIADSQLIFCEGIKKILQNDEEFKIVDVAVSFTEMYQKIEQYHPNILIIDFESTANCRIEELGKLRKKLPKLKILVISTNRSKEAILRVLKQDITNYIFKDCDIDEFINALKSTAQRKKFFNGYIIEVLLKKKTGDQEENPVNSTQKEIEIIRLLSQGLTTKDIANKLFISVHTVNTHRKNILHKLGLKNTSELIMYAVKKGIVDSIEYYI